MATTFSVKQIKADHCFSYVLASDSQVLLVDPHITKVQAYRDYLRKKDLHLNAVLDTHTHADHLSATAVVAGEYDCPIIMSDKAVSSLDIRRVGEGDVVTFGQARLDVFSAPGHTDDSIALLGGGYVFTGDVLMIGSVGRTDFQNGSPEDMFDTLAKLKTLPDDTVVCPAHDYKGNTRSTVGKEKASNLFMRETDRHAFAANARAKVLPKPFNMDAIIATNRQGLAREIEYVSPAEARRRLEEEGDLWEVLDVRRPDEYQAVHIEQSRNIPLDTVASRLQEIMSSDRYFIVSCQSGPRSIMAASILAAAGAHHVSVMEGGLAAWRKQGAPVIRRKVPISLERQVRAIAGGLGLAGSLLALLVSPWFFIIPIWVGAGLLFAGLTNNCLMGMLLMKLPYNRKALQPAEPAGGACAMDADSSGGCAM